MDLYVAYGYFYRVLPAMQLSELGSSLRPDESAMTTVAQVEKSSQRSIIDINKIIEQCVYIEIPDTTTSYIVHFPNVLECD